MFKIVVCSLLVLLCGYESYGAVTPKFIAAVKNVQKEHAAQVLRSQTVSTEATPKLWAVLVAGSNGWYNYRHQADICHAYQILHSHGIPDEQIVVMMYDDLAKNDQNPTPGVVINHPQGKDVYKGVLRDYVQDDVTPANFLKVLKGDSKGLAGVGSGKVLGSGPNDHVFVYFADHGAPGIIAFPTDELAAEDLNAAIKSMHDNKQYEKMVIYIEACESGSMFESLLPKNINVYATTASNSEESSYACYFDEDRETYLGDVYSVNWMEDSDQNDLTQETLKQQFQVVQKETNTSHVTQFGDLSISNLHVSEFQGKESSANVVAVPKVPRDPIRSEDVPFGILKHKLHKALTKKDWATAAKLEKQLVKMTNNRRFLAEKVVDIIAIATGDNSNVLGLAQRRLPLRNFQCYSQARKYFDQECFDLSKNPFALRVLYSLVNLCEIGVSVPALQLAMDEVCTHPPIHGIL